MMRGLRASFPDTLRLHEAKPWLEVAGRRAWAAQSADGALQLLIDGQPLRIEVEPALAEGAVDIWPFAASRESDRGGDALFAAADQPMIVIERLTGAHAALTVRRSGDASVAIYANGTLEDSDAFVVPSNESGAVRLCVQPRSLDRLDADALVGGTIARARRRAAQRPRIVRPVAGGETTAALERALRLERAADRRSDLHQATLAVLAFLALDDAPAALEAAREVDEELERDGARATIVAGAWAAWRGTAIPLDGVRNGARSFPIAARPESALERAACSLAAFAADAIGGAAGPAKSEVEPAGALAALARSSHEAGASARLLHLVHGSLGVMPDAPTGRVRIGPTLEPGTTRVDRLGFGDATLDLEAHVTDERAIIVLEQTAGATPVTAILEPSMVARRLRDALVEDTPAQLDTVLDGTGIRVRIQLVIDRRRTLVLNFGED